MAWTDEPSDKQIGALLNLARWQINRDEVKDIVDYLKTNATKRDLSAELGRIRDLKIERKLNRDRLFEGKLWTNFNK